MKKIMLIFALTAMLFSLPIASAIVVSFVDSSPLSPGKSGELIITVKNVLDGDVEDVSFSLDLSGRPFVADGSSEFSVDEIGENDEEDFAFRLRPSYDIKPGDYAIPYTITYTHDNTEGQQRKGTIGVSVIAQPELEFVLNEETPVIGMQGKIGLKIINNGLADARFVSVRIVPEGFSLLSEDQSYIGTVSSDDFESVDFDVRYSKSNPNVIIYVEYRDLDNKKISLKEEIPFEAYTKEEAIERGIIQKSNASFYTTIVIVIVVLWFVWRYFRKRKRMKAAREAA